MPCVCIPCQQLSALTGPCRCQLLQAHPEAAQVEDLDGVHKGSKGGRARAHSTMAHTMPPHDTGQNTVRGSALPHEAEHPLVTTSSWCSPSWQAWSPCTTAWLTMPRLRLFAQ